MNGKRRVLTELAAMGLMLPALATAEPAVEVPGVVLDGVAFTATVRDAELPSGATRTVTVSAGGDSRTVTLLGPDPASVEEVRLSQGEVLQVAWDGGSARVRARILPGWVSLVPPLLAILLAIAFRQAVLALLAGVWVGAFLVTGSNPFASFLRVFDDYVVGALTDRSNATLLLFTFTMGGMLGIITRTGGIRGIVELVAPRAGSAKSGQIAAWFMGLLVFFDDYANTLLVGNTMRPITDRLRISREKLAYIVDSTAAPVASIALVSTWIGVEVGLIGDAFRGAGLERDAFAAFVASLPYRFYPILALVFGFMIAAGGRDFGPMLRAERRARSTGETLRPGSQPLADYEGKGLEPDPERRAHWADAAVPILVMVAAILAFLYTTGAAAAREAGSPLDLKSVLGNADSYAALLWGSLLGSAAAFLMAAGRRVLTLNETVAAWVGGAKSIFMAAIILTLAWSISDVSSRLGTAPYLVDLLGDTLDPRWLPVLVFLLAGFASFATGSSWGTMGILIPLVIPLALSLAPGSEAILSGTISSVLAGAVWGDHCSPISDTTVLSSMASSVDHMDHVNTQLPYAMTVGAVAVAFGEIPTAFGLPYWVAWVAGAVVLWAILRWVGARSES